MLSVVLIVTIALIMTHFVLNSTITVSAVEEKHTVPLNEIVNGGPPPDGIP